MYDRVYVGGRRRKRSVGMTSRLLGDTVSYGISSYLNFRHLAAVFVGTREIAASECRSCKMRGGDKADSPGVGQQDVVGR
jgi:hypothetical protein